MKDTAIELYQFKDFDMDEFISKYLYIVNPHEVVDADTLSVYTAAKMQMTKKRTGARAENVITNKCMYLQDAIIRRANSRKDNKTFSLNAAILRTVIGKEYKPMLEVFIEMGYIELGDGRGGKEKPSYYQAGKYSTIYTMKDVKVYKTAPIFNAAVQKYKTKTISEIENQTNNVLYPAIKERHGRRFLDRYLVSLNHIRIEDRKGLNTYISDAISENPNTEPYYNYVVNQLDIKRKELFRIDNSGRMYHILTNLDRDVKKFLNIDLALDCKNSHPVLFNYFIYNKLNIPVSVAYNISEFLVSLSNGNIDHNDGKNLRNELIKNNIENIEVTKLSNDELEYIYMTSTGRLWDDICSRHPDLDRNAVKVEMFKAVFYSHSPVADRWNEYAREFKVRFPSVYRLIGDWKRARMAEKVKGYMAAHHLPTDKGSASLSVAMMALEAEIFTTILKRLYARRWNALHIHDCIVIPKDGNKNHPTKDNVLAIMRDVYKDFGLCPTFS